MNSNVDSILNLINKTIIDNYSIKLWVPSLLLVDSDYILFKPLSISQQKDLLSTALTQNIYNTSFVITCYNILKENYLSNDIIPLNQLTVLDRLIILLSLKSNISPKFQNIEINQIIANIQNSNFSVFAPQSLESDNIKLYCSLPTIHAEYMCEKEREEFNTENLNEQIQHIVSETVINELTKFCNTVVINEETIVFNNFSFAERKQILNTLPAFLLEKALNYVIDCRKQIEDYLTVDIDENTKDTLQINGVFFSTV
jgi:hypothetical protein